MIYNKLHSLRINVYFKDGSYSETQQLVFNKHDSFELIYSTFKEQYNRLSSKSCYSLNMSVYNTSGVKTKNVIKLTNNDGVVMAAYNKELLPINIFKYLSPIS